jgi:hypothetical protein
VDDDQRAEFARRSRTWHDAEHAYHNEAAEYFAISEVVALLIVDEAAANKLTAMRQAADDARREWHDAIRAMQTRPT